jgi:hypothetical protein
MGIISDTAQCLADLNQCSKDYQIVANALLGAAMLVILGGGYKLNEWAHTGKFDLPPERPSKQHKTADPIEPSGTA